MRNVLTVFIASPSDLAPERQRAFDVVADVNDVLRPTNWAIELLGWEDTLPGYGRPQALINRDVERCDLFIGAVWRRWGTAPATDSLFSSGLEEEFSIAVKRRDRTPSPEIWVFFKKVDLAQIADAGAQLQRVIAFRESLVASKTVLFKEFEDVAAWEKMLRTYLIRHVLDLSSGSTRWPQGPSEPASVVGSNAPCEPSGTATPGAGDQLAKLAHSLAPAFASGDLDEVAKSIDDPDETAFLAVRVFLLSVALVAASRTSASLMPPHELNTLYRYRERLLATDDEMYVLFRTLLADEFDVSPGWFWLKDLGTRAIIVRLLSVIVYDDNSGARATSFSVLRGAAVPIFPQFRESLLTETFPALPAQVHDEAWAYLVDVATAEDVKTLGRASGTWLESRVGWLQAWLDAGRDLDQFLPKSPDPQFLSNPLKQLIAESIPKLSDPSLGALSSMPVTDLSEKAAAEMERKRPGPASGAAGPRRRRRRANWPSLLSVGPLFGGSPEARDADDERYERLGRQSSDELKLALDWYSLDGRISYQLLTERGEISREVVRADINHGFQRIRESSDEHLESVFGPAAAAKIRQDFAELHDFIAKQSIEKAIAALALDSTRDDVAVARQLLTNDRTRSAALEIIAANGDASDVQRLLEIARTSFGDDRITALKGIRRLASDRLATAKVLIAAETRDMRRAALALVRDVDDAEVVRFLKELLSHDDEEARLTAVALLRMRLENAQLLELLRDYIGKGTYYYNVVTWLDRLLYAPEPMSGYYATKLDGELKEVMS
ncbi:MAG: DUF4062 domain-containing protein [Luteitalea sp.]|nr:DUF4062 domain-containing protein [Luteitalea sp.]